MKTKILKMSILISIVGITLFACNKNEIVDTVQTENIINAPSSEISADEIQSIINSVYSNTEAPDWWVKFKKWVKSHIGVNQRYDEFGQPLCSGDMECGPCPGICLVGIGMTGTTNNNNYVSQANYALGFRALGINVIENINTNETKIMFEFNLDLNNFVEDGILYIDSDSDLSTNIVNEAGYTSITILHGEYPVFETNSSGIYSTVVNATFN